VATIAAELGLPADAEAMTPEQQYAVFDRLDAHVRQHDPELWRTKQVSDCVGGIWGQVFSKPTSYCWSPTSGWPRPAGGLCSAGWPCSRRFRSAGTAGARGTEAGDRNRRGRRTAAAAAASDSPDDTEAPATWVGTVPEALA
jgi:hypothetical protein